MYMQRCQHATTMAIELCQRGTGASQAEIEKLTKLLIGEETLQQVAPMWNPSQHNEVGPSQHHFFP